MRPSHRAVLIALAACLLPAAALEAQGGMAPAKTPEEEVRAVVARMFEGMRTADSAMVRSTLAPGARFALLDGRSSPVAIRYDQPDGWLSAIAGSARRWEERLADVQVRVDGGIAQVWAPYAFYLDGKLRHCGVDSMELLRDATGWRITQLSDTQRREGCRELPPG